MRSGTVDVCECANESSHVHLGTGEDIGHKCSKLGVGRFPSGAVRSAHGIVDGFNGKVDCIFCQGE